MVAIATPPPTGTRFDEWIDLRDYDVDPLGNNDSTAGLQQAIDQADATGASCDILAPGGDYVIAGPIRADGGQVSFPSWGAVPIGTHAPVIRLRGTALPNHPWVHYPSAGRLPPRALTNFRSALTSGNGAVFSVAGPAGSTGGQPPQGGYFSCGSMVFEDLQLVTGPSLGGINAGLAWSLQVRRCFVTPVDTGGYAFPLPTNPTQTGIVTPLQWNNQNNSGRIESSLVQGMYTGARLSEHTNVDHMMTSMCFNGVIFLRSQHVVTMINYCSQHNRNGIGFEGTDFGDYGNKTRIFVIMSGEQEPAGGPYGAGATLNDPGNLGSGRIYHSMNHALIGFTQLGGAGIVVESLG